MMLISDGPLNDYIAYRNGDRFYVVIPQAEMSALQTALKGDGFTDAKVEKHGADVVLSFVLRPGATANVSQKFNRLSVVIAIPSESSNMERAARAIKQIPITGALANSMAPQATKAAQAAQFQNDNKTSTSDVDLSVPESPAFTVLGVTPETVARPTSPKEFATSLLNGVDKNGNFQSGIAFDAAPVLVFWGRGITLYRYNTSPAARFFSRIQTSFATTKGTSDADKSTRLALGLRLTPWDEGDPRTDDALHACYKDESDKLFAGPSAPGKTDWGPFYPPLPRDPDARAKEEAKREKILADALDPCDKAARKRNLYASSWIIGAAPSWISTTGKNGDYKWNGGGFWTSVAYGFRIGKDDGDANEESFNNSQLILHARYRDNEQVPDSDNKGQFFSQDSLFLGTRLRAGTANTTASFEGIFIRSRRDKNPFDNSYRLSMGLEQRIAENIWFSLALGGDNGRSDGNNQTFVMTSFKWGFSKKTTPTATPPTPTQ